MTALGRRPAPAQIEAARQLLSKMPNQDAVRDFLWTVVMLPEFQLIY